MISDNDIQRGVKVVVIAAIVLMVGLVALTLVGAVVGLVWEFVCRVVPIVLFCAVVLAAVVGDEVKAAKRVYYDIR